MAPFRPVDVIFPQNRIKKVIEVLHDGTTNSPYEFSIAKLELKNGNTCYGLRYNINEWNENNPDLGYPTCRPGNPTWFILPDENDLLKVMNKVFVVK
jgi:hypothetical protein